MAETAFLIARHDGVLSDADLAQAEEDARAFVSQLPRSDQVTSPLTNAEWYEIEQIRTKIAIYTSTLAEPEFSPVVPGCGVVDQAVCDVTSGSEIVEVKAVVRPFRSMDFRQLLTYMAMLYASGKRFDRLTLLNPRTAWYFSAEIDSVASGSGGKTGVELLQELVEWMIGLQVSA